MLGNDCVSVTLCKHRNSHSFPLILQQPIRKKKVKGLKQYMYDTVLVEDNGTSYILVGLNNPDTKTNLKTT